MNHEDELRAYQEDAEDMYDDFDSDYEDDFDSGLDGNEDGYDDDYEEFEYVDDDEDDYDEYDDDYEDEDDDFDSYKQTSIGRIDPNDRTYTVIVKNEGQTDAIANLFGGYAEKPQPAGVTVDVQESSHKQVREESKSNPFLIHGIKLSVSNPLQLDNVLYIKHKRSTGRNAESVWQPRNSSSPANFSQNIIDDANFEAKVSGYDSIEVNVKAGVTMVFTFTIKARANMGNLLEGKNVAEMSTTPRTTGVPGIDLVRKSGARKPFGIKSKRRRVRKRPVRRIVRRKPARRVKRRRR